MFFFFLFSVSYNVLRPQIPCWQRQTALLGLAHCQKQHRAQPEAQLSYANNHSGVYVSPLSVTSNQYFSCPKSLQGQLPDNQRPPVQSRVHQHYSNQPILNHLRYPAFPTTTPIKAMAQDFPSLLLLPPDQKSHASPVALRGMPPSLRKFKS